MKKSIFAKYTVAFLVIIIVSFIALALIITSMLIRRTNDNRKEKAVVNGDYVVNFIEEGYALSGRGLSFSAFVEDRKSLINGVLESLITNEDVESILITDEKCVIVAASDRSVLGLDISSDDTLRAIGGNESVISRNSFNDLYGSRLGKVIMPVTCDGEVIGLVIVCFDVSHIDALTTGIIKTIVVSSLWVMIVTLIAIYSINASIASPIQQMSHATKLFSSGKFDVRIKVNGNDEISELAEGFNNMADSLSSLEYMRSSFLAAVSHDLRTPMTTISGYIDGMLSGAIPPEKHEYYLNVISSEVKRLSRLVGSMLDISRIQAGDRKFEKRSFDICETARLVLISFEEKIEKKNLDVEFDCPDRLEVFSDKDAVHQILYNLCENAIKFSNEGGKYRISIKTSGKKAYVSVFDEGIGIPPEDLPYVFDRFYKSDKSRSLDKSGVGLGLFIVKTMIEALGEKISVNSEYHKNCEFVFSLQLSEPSQIIIEQQMQEQ